MIVGLTDNRSNLGHHNRLLTSQQEVIPDRPALLK
jgi:hypothetical protein